MALRLHASVTFCTGSGWRSHFSFISCWHQCWHVTSRPDCLLTTASIPGLKRFKHSYCGTLLGPSRQLLPFSFWAASWQNQKRGMCAHWRLRSAWASAQSEQSSLCAQWVAKDPRFLRADSGCPGWSESSLGAHAILLVLSWGGSFDIVFLKYTLFSFFDLSKASQLCSSSNWYCSTESHLQHMEDMPICSGYPQYTE